MHFGQKIKSRSLGKRAVDDITTERSVFLKKTVLTANSPKIFQVMYRRLGDY